MKQFLACVVRARSMYVVAFVVAAAGLLLSGKMGARTVNVGRTQPAASLCIWNCLGW